MSHMNFRNNVKTARSGQARHNEGGQAAVEFAVIVPMVLVIISVVVELTMIFIETEKVSNIGRELAKVVYYECSGRIFGEAAFVDCMDSSLLDIRHRASSALKDFDQQGKLIATVYQSSQVAGTIDNSYMDESDPAPVIPGLTTRFPTVAGLGINGAVSGLNIQDVGVIVVSEVYYRYTPKTPLGNFFNNYIRDFFYEATII